MSPRFNIDPTWRPRPFAPASAAGAARAPHGLPCGPDGTRLVSGPERLGRRPIEHFEEDEHGLPTHAPASEWVLRIRNQIPADARDDHPDVGVSPEFAGTGVF